MVPPVQQVDHRVERDDASLDQVNNTDSTPLCDTPDPSNAKSAAKVSFKLLLSKYIFARSELPTLRQNTYQPALFAAPANVRISATSTTAGRHSPTRARLLVTGGSIQVSDLCINYSASSNAHLRRRPPISLRDLSQSILSQDHPHKAP